MKNPLAFMFEDDDEEKKHDDIPDDTPPPPKPSQSKNYVPLQTKEYVPATGPNPASAYSSAISDDERKKSYEYFKNLIANVQTPNLSYKQFIATVDAMGNAIPENTRYAAAYAGLNVQGLSKQTLIDTANIVLQAITNNAAEFKGKMDKRYNDNVEAKKKLAQDKVAQIDKLNKEIIDLTTQAREEELHINTSMQVYNVCSSEFVSKIQQDINNINKYIS